MRKQLSELGNFTRECQVQIPLIDLLCENGADPTAACRPLFHTGSLKRPMRCFGTALA